MANIKKVQLPSGTEYDIKDATARTQIASKQDTLVSGTNIKTVNNTSLLGSGNIAISSGVTDVTLDGTSVVSGSTAILTSATLTASDDGNGNVTIGLTGIGALSTASGVSF